MVGADETTELWRPPLFSLYNLLFDQTQVTLTRTVDPDHGDSENCDQGDGILVSVGGENTHHSEKYHCTADRCLFCLHLTALRMLK